MLGMTFCMVFDSVAWIIVKRIKTIWEVHKRYDRVDPVKKPQSC